MAQTLDMALLGGKPRWEAWLCQAVAPISSSLEGSQWMQPTAMEMNSHPLGWTILHNIGPAAEPERQPRTWALLYYACKGNLISFICYLVAIRAVPWSMQRKISHPLHLTC